MNNYCTLFDSFYLSRGISLLNSLKRVTSDFHLYIFAFDDVTFDVIQKLNCENVTVISLRDFETPELLEVKKTRSVAEYCWTCTPSTISYVFKKYKVTDCTYIDSDLIFYSDPSVLIDELKKNGKSVLITEHRFTTLPRLYEQKRAGRFCVQFVTFLNEEGSLRVLEKWRNQCIDWCYARHEDGKFGDQKYLDEWPEVYPFVHILEHPGGGIAPWNLTDYSFSFNDGKLTGKIRKNSLQFPVIFFHFQYVKFMENNMCDIGWYHIGSAAREIFYKSYLQEIDLIEREISNLNPKYSRGLTRFNTDNLKNSLKTFLKKSLGYNILNLNNYGVSN